MEAVDRIMHQPGIEVSQIDKRALVCVACAKHLGFMAMRTMAPADGSFAFQVRVSCPACGPEVAALTLQTEDELGAAS